MLLQLDQQGRVKWMAFLTLALKLNFSDSLLELRDPLSASWDVSHYITARSDLSSISSFLMSISKVQYFVSLESFFPQHVPVWATWAQSRIIAPRAPTWLWKRGKSMCMHEVRHVHIPSLESCTPWVAQETTEGEDFNELTTLAVGTTEPTQGSRFVKFLHDKGDQRSCNNARSGSHYLCSLLFVRIEVSWVRHWSPFSRNVVYAGVTS